MILSKPINATYENYRGKYDWSKILMNEKNDDD